MLILDKRLALERIANMPYAESPLAPERHVSYAERQRAMRSSFHAIGKPLTGSLAQRLYMKNPEAARALAGKPVSAALLQWIFFGREDTPVPGYHA